MFKHVEKRRFLSLFCLLSGRPTGVPTILIVDYLFLCLIAACAAASLAIGTLNGEQET